MNQEQVNSSNEKKTFGQIVAAAFKELGETLVAFVKAPRALYGINIPYIIEGLVYFGILTVLGKYCSENVNLSDVHAGWVYGGVTGGITFAMLLLGGITDKIGVRASLALAFAVMALGRTLVSLSGSLNLATGMGSPTFFIMIIGLFLMVSAYGLYQPAAYAGVKRYTNPQTAAMGYAVLYALMNLGAFIFGPISSFTRQKFETVFPPNGLSAVFWLMTIFTVTSLILTLVMITRKVDRNAVERVARESKAMNVESGKEEKQPAAAPQHKINNTAFMIYAGLTIAAVIVFILSLQNQDKLFISLAAIFMGAAIIVTGWEYLRHRPDHPFRDKRLVAFIFVLIPVQTLFAHNWLTIPYYLDRMFAGSWVGRNFEILSNLNPIIIFVVTPIIAGLTARANVYKMMIIGTFVMAAPTFLLAVGPVAIFFVIYIIIMSIGEAMWQPRFLQYIAEIAPEGKTGAYMGIGQFPWFLTKLITSLYSGWFIANYVPKPDSGIVPRSGQMWLIYAFIAIISPFALLAMKKWMLKGMKTRA